MSFDLQNFKEVKNSVIMFKVRKKTVFVTQSTLPPPLSKDRVFRDKKHSDTFSCILVGSILFGC